MKNNKINLEKWKHDVESEMLIKILSVLAIIVAVLIYIVVKIT